MRTFGLTGSIASGKSAVSRLLEPYWPVVEADEQARQVVEPGSEGLQAVVAAFGERLLNPEGSLKRTLLRKIIANSRSSQQCLNGILHPLIVARIGAKVQQLAEAGHTQTFVSAALMLETGSYRNYDGVILVSAPFEERLKRLLKRDGMDEKSARNLMDKQMPDIEKRKYALVEIANTGSLEELAQRTWSALATLGVTKPGRH